MYVCMVVCVERIQRSKTRTVEGEGIQHFLPMIHIYKLYVFSYQRQGSVLEKTKKTMTFNLRDSEAG